MPLATLLLANWALLEIRPPLMIEEGEGLNSNPLGLLLIAIL